MCHYTEKNTNKQEYNAIRKEINSSIPQKHKIPSYYQVQKKYCQFIGGIHKNNNNPNTDDILKAPSDMNFDTNEKDYNTLDTIKEVRNKEDISTILGDEDINEKKIISDNENNTHGYFTGSEATIEDLKYIGVNVKDDIKYYADLSGGAHEIM